MNDNAEDSNNRQFICACGKNYLSYAALFTHIKQKHEGKVNVAGPRPLDPSSGPVLRGKEGDLARTRASTMISPRIIRIMETLPLINSRMVF